MENSERLRRDAFKTMLKKEWSSLWTERFDDKTRAEGVSVRDYAFVFMSQGDIIFASRDAKSASLSEIIEYWSSQGFLYSPEPALGGWNKFIRAELKKQVHSRATEFRNSQAEKCSHSGRLKKSGRGWLHVE